VSNTISNVPLIIISKTSKAIIAAGISNKNFVTRDMCMLLGSKAYIDQPVRNLFLPALSVIGVLFRFDEDNAPQAAPNKRESGANSRSPFIWG
jgi:hypothetical protein